VNRVSDALIPPEGSDMLLRRWPLLMLACLGLTLTVPNARSAPAPGRAARTDRYGDPLPPGAVARLGTVRLHKDCGIDGIAFSPDSRRVASSRSDRLFLWDVHTGRLLRALDKTLTCISHLVFTPDGRRLIAADRFGEWLVIWDVVSGKEVGRLKGPWFYVTALAIAPGGKTVACGDHQGAVQVRDLNGILLFAGAPSRQWVRSLAFTPDGKGLAVLEGGSGDSYRVRLLDMATGKERRRLALAGAERVALAPDGGVVATFRTTEGLWLWEVAGGKKWRLASGKRLTSCDLSFSPDARSLLTAERRGDRLRVWDVSSGKQRRILKVPGVGEVRGVVLSPDGTTLAGSVNRSVLRLWDATTGRPYPLPLAHSRPVTALAFSRDGKTLLSASSEDGIVYCSDDRMCQWEVGTGRLLTSRALPDLGFTHDLRFSPDGRWAVSYWQRDVYLLDARTGKDMRRLGGHEKWPAGVAFSPCGNTLATACSGLIRLWDLPAGKLRRRIDVQKWLTKNIYWLAFSPDGRILALGDGPWRVHLCEVATGRHLGRMDADQEKWRRRGFSNVSWKVFFSPDGRTLFTANGGNCRVWDLVSRREVEPPEEAERAVYPYLSAPVDLSPDGRLLARFDRFNGPGLWETASGQQVYRFPGKYSSVAFAPDGRTLATGYIGDCSILIWSLKSTGRKKAKRVAGGLG
jgi:WD40 repeat protein